MFALFGGEICIFRLAHFSCGVLHRKIQLPFQLADIHTHKAFLFGKRAAGFNCVIQYISKHRTKLNIAHRQLVGNIRFYVKLYVHFLRNIQLAVEDSVCHNITSLYYGIHRVQIVRKLVQIVGQLVIIALGKLNFHIVYMVAVIVPPAAHLTVHILYLTHLLFDKLTLKALYSAVYHIV